jgi:hypothetical protein
VREDGFVLPRLLALGLFAIAVIGSQGCLVGRSLYYQEDPSTDELQSNSTVADGGDGGVAKGDGSIANVVPPGPPAVPPLAADAGTTEMCQPINVACVVGGGMELCLSYSNGMCTKITYKHNGKSYSCPTACTGQDCLGAYYGAYTACQDAVGACADLATCCKNATEATQASCMQAYNTYAGQPYGDVSCKSIAASFRMQKFCP